LKNKINLIRNDIFNFLKYNKYNIQYKKLNNNFKLILILKYYLNIYYNNKKLFQKFKKINTKFIKNTYILTININNIKPRINLFLNKNLLLNLSSGIIKKKLDIKTKNVKKNQKMLKLMIKILSYNIIRIYNIDNLIIYVKGLKTKLNNLLPLLKKYFNIRKNIFIFTPAVIHNKLKFKKNKAIKRKLKKKFIKA
jgi:hypothetical protein